MFYTNTITITFGDQAGFVNQGDYSISVGDQAGLTNQGDDAVSIGSSAGKNGQSTNAIAIGNGAGLTTQGAACVAIGRFSGFVNQGATGIAIGNEAARNNQSPEGVAIGSFAGSTGQGKRGIAIGVEAGFQNQLDQSIAIGRRAGRLEQFGDAVAIGTFAGENTQGSASIAIGNGAGQNSQATYCIAIGAYAGFTNQATNTIILNADNGNILNGVPGQTGSFYVKPIREANGPQCLFYEPTSGEITRMSPGFMRYTSDASIVATSAGSVDIPGWTLQGTNGNGPSVSPEGLITLNRRPAYVSLQVQLSAWNNAPDAPVRFNLRLIDQDNFIIAETTYQNNDISTGSGSVRVQYTSMSISTVTDVDTLQASIFYQLVGGGATGNYFVLGSISQHIINAYYI